MKNSRALFPFLFVVLAIAGSQLVGARPSAAADPSFAALGAGISGAFHGTTAWGDYNSDGYLDLVVTGMYNDGADHCVGEIWENDQLGGFDKAEPASTDIADLCYSSAAWGDYDSDGDLDLLLAGSDVDGARASVIYENEVNEGGLLDFSEDSVAEADLTPVDYGSVAWGDYDSDGDLDILLTGMSDSGRVSQIYENDEGVFEEDTVAGTGLPGVDWSSVSWGDFDGDGDLDLLLTGKDASDQPLSEIYVNDGDGTFSDGDAGLYPVYNGSVASGDYDSDGDLDILLSGSINASVGLAYLYQNGGGLTFTVPVSFQYVSASSVSFGDQDADGDLDALVSGDVSSSYVSWVYENRWPAGWNSAPSGYLTGLALGSGAWGDYDNDGQLDIVLSGQTSVGGRFTDVYQNGAAGANTAPSAPSGLASSDSIDEATLSWNAGSDSETSTTGLTYNLRVGTTEGGSDVVSPMASPNGVRQLPKMGNVGQATSYTLEDLAPGTYYWSVQTIDNNFEGSVFADEGTFDVGFQDIGVGLTGVDSSSVAWGDYDNDGHLDALLSGRNQLGYTDTSIFRNDGAGGFAPITESLEDVKQSSVVWGDYDADGDLDILLTGYDSSNGVTSVYRNNGGVFTDIDAGLTDVYNGSVAWGDYDSDGDLDIALSGNTQTGSTNAVTMIYRNDNGVFSDIGAGLVGVVESSLAWGDYDSDGNLDLLVTGCSAYTITCDARVSNIYRNDGAGGFSDIAAGLTPVSMSSAAWGDYDSDGELDLVLSGVAGGSRAAKIYHASGGTFTDIGAGLTGISGGSAAWGDYDADGDLDLLLTGNETGNQVSRIYQNQGSDNFNLVDSGLIGVENSSAAWGDYDSDGRLDILLSGWNDDLGIPTSRIYKNYLDSANTPPTAPSNLTSSISGEDGFVLNWDASSDGQTIDARGLTYNLRVGTTPGGSDVVSPMALVGDTADGTRLLPKMGSVIGATSYLLKNLPADTYYWSVQAVDNGFAGSAFATEDSFTVPGSFAFSSASYSVGESGGSATITIERSGSTAGSDSVHFSTANGSASAGSDYTAITDQVVDFAPGERSKAVSVPVTDDAAYEGNETVSLSLSSPSLVGNPSTATLTIVDNDYATVALSSSSYSVSESGSSASVTINRTGALASSVSVHFATANGSAAAGSDYTAVSSTVSFAAGETSKTVSVPILDDSSVESPETVQLNLSSPSMGTSLASPSSATLTITDNDKGEPAVSTGSARVGRIVSAKLSKKVFARVQARKVKLVYRFSPKSKVFKYVLSYKKGKKWLTVKTVKRTGNFAGTRRMTVKALFARKAIKSGRYRVRLYADTNSKLLAFRVK